MSGGRYRSGRWALLDVGVLFASVCAALPSTSDAALPVRFPVEQAGLYRISFESLGLPVPIAAAGLTVTNRGVPVAIEVADGGDGQFGPGDAILFYGEPIAPGDPESKYTDENVYWLAQGAAEPPRMEVWAGEVLGAPEQTFRNTHHAEESWAYWQRMPNGVGLDHWFWGRAIRAGTSRTFQFALSAVAGGGAPAELRLALHGETGIAAVDPDHHTRAWLNGALLGDILWDGQVAMTHTFSDVATALLREGTNTLTVEEVEDAAVAADAIFVNWIEVAYDRAFTAAGDRLAFSATGAGARTFTIGGFSSAAISVYDVTDPLRPRRLANPSVTAQGGGHAVSFAADPAGGADYLAVAAPGVTAATPVVPGHAFSLKAAGNGADYIIVTHASLAAAVAALAQHRAGQGYRVKVVTTEQIYDEFAGGIFTPEAIKGFLRHAYEHWARPAPQFVALIGDANFDYQDYLGTGQINHVPAYLIETTGIGETPSDHWFVTVAGDDVLPAMYIGRIPAKTTAEVAIVTKKIVAYENGTMPGAWPSRVLMATGDQEPGFRESAAEWLTHLPAHYTKISISPAVSNPRGEFSRALNNGVGLVAYFGHGQVDRWLASDTGGGGGISDLMLITSEDAAGLANYRAFPFFVAFSCLNGLFAAPQEGAEIPLPDGTAIEYSVPLPEALLFQADRGAIAMWSPSAFAYPTEEHSIGLEFFKGLYEDGNTVLGAVTTQAKVNAYLRHGVHAANLDVFTLIGDPATRLTVTASTAGASSSGGGGAMDPIGLILLPAGVLGLRSLRRRIGRFRSKKRPGMARP